MTALEIAKRAFADYYLETFDVGTHVIPSGRFYFLLKAKNGKIVMVSEGYNAKKTRDRIVNRIGLKHGFSIREEMKA